MNGRQLRYRGGVAAALVLVAAGIVDRNGTLVLAAAAPLSYVLLASLSTVELPDELTVERRIEPRLAAPGEVVTVALTVQNGSDRTVTDLRVADGVPDELAVIAGSPRAGVTLGPGEETAVRYRVAARRGEYPFDPPDVRLRGLGAAAVATRRPAVTGEDELVCRLDADAPPIEEHGRGRAGTLTTDDPGRGVSFHSVREYREDDPADRIDWRHYAKRGELAAVNYDHEVTGTVVLAVDARTANRVVAGEGRPTAVELSAYAATRAATDLLRSGHDVGLAVLGLDGPGPSGLHWQPPAGGSEQRSRLLGVLRVAVDADPDPVDAGPQTRELLELVPSGGQIALFSPLLDNAPATGVGTWRGAGLPVTVLSPDVVPGNTVSGQYAQVRRRTRLVACQDAGARTYDWRRGTPLPVAIEQAFRSDARRSLARAIGGGR